MTSLSDSAPRSARRVGVLFFVEMALSPLLAAIALLVPVAAHWGAYKYVPAIVWFVVFAHCLVTFRWRGLWFALGLPVAFLVIEAFLVAAPPVPRKEPQASVIGADAPKAMRPGATDTTGGSSATEPPLIIRNPDGTFTVQKQPRNGTAKDDGQEKALRIPPQVIVPMTPGPDRDRK